MTRTSPIIKVLTTRDIKPYYVKVLGLQKIESENITRLINKFRSISTLVRVQAIDSDAIFGMNHLIRVLQITLELWNRRIRISRSLESDLLMRLCCTDQMNNSIKLGGLKKDRPACLILISQNESAILAVEATIASYCTHLCRSVLRPGNNKMEKLRMKYGIQNNNTDRRRFENSLVERAALAELI